MARRTAFTSGAVSVGTSSTPILPDRYGGRGERTIINDGANVVYLAFSTAGDTAGVPTGPVAVANSGVRLNANGGSWSSNVYWGPVAGIALTGATNVTVTEF